MSDHELGVNFKDLTDEEIQTLHEIVTLSDEQPGAHFGARLFKAYDEIIKRYETPPEVYSKYFKFLLRLLRERKQHESAMERFVGLLAEGGINVEPLSDQEGTDYGSTEELGPAQNSFERARLGSRDGRNGIPLSSAETLHGDEDAPQSLQKGSIAPATGTQDSTNFRPFRKHTRRSQSEDTHMHGIPGMERGRQHGRVASAQLTTRGRRMRSVSSTRSLRINRTYEPTFGNGDAYAADESDLSDATRSRRHSVTSAAPPMPMSAFQDARSFLPAGLLQRSDEQLDAIAEGFIQTKDRIVQRRTMARWNKHASHARAGHDQLNLLAQNHDRSLLLKKHWSLWRNNLDALRLDREWQAKSQVYATLEKQATEARKLNLKWVALSHWKVFAIEEKERKCVARRHIVRKRNFEAWHQITAVNELKIRRFVLRQFFNKWQRRSHQLQARENQAIVKHEQDLARRTYFKWFYAFAERTAPEFHDRKLERQSFEHWRSKLHQQLDKEDHAVEHCVQGIERGHLVSWWAKARELLDMNRQAQDFRKGKLLGDMLSTWRRETSLAPRERILTSRFDASLQTSVFQQWRTRVSQSRQAAEIDRQRTLRNAFTAWNDQLRTNFLRGQIDIRLKTEYLYRWRIASRSAIAGREHDRMLLANVMHSWLSKAETRQRTIEGAEATFEVSQRQRALRGAFGNMMSKYQHNYDMEVEANNFRRTRLLYGTFAKWQQRSADVDLLNRKANAAEFYILTTKTLKRWTRSTKEHQKYRKREAYSQIRRLCKMNLAREMLGRMQIQLAHVRNMDHYSLEFQEDHVVTSTTSAFRRWKQRAVTCLDQERQAEEHHARKLTGVYLLKMVQRKNELQTMAMQARELSAGSAGVEAMNCLRKLDRRLFQIRGQDQWASALREKHLEKHRKNMLRYWHEQAMASPRQRQDGTHGEDVFRASTMTRPELEDLTVFDHTAWNLEPLDLNLNAFPDVAQGEIDATFIDNDGIITSTPMPGYLRTPSKRSTARAKARERLAANAPAVTGRTIRFADQVPATAPPRAQSATAPPVLPSPAGPSITPFERRLREQGYTSPSAGRRTPAFGAGGRFGASVGSVGRFGATPARSAFAGFEDIPEVSEDRSRG